MTSLLASPDTPNPDFTATTTLPRCTGSKPPPAPEPAPPPSLALEPDPSPAESSPPNAQPSLFAPDSLFYKRPDTSPPPSDNASEPALAVPDSVLDGEADGASASPEASAVAEPAPEPSLLAPDSIFYKRSDPPQPPTDSAAPTALASSPASDSSLLAPDSLSYADANRTPSTDSAPSNTPEPPLLAPTSLFYAPADPAPPTEAPAAEPLLSPTSLFYATADPPSPAPEPPAFAEPPTPAPQPQSATTRHTPNPLLVTSAPHDPTAADRRARLVLHHASEPGDALLCRLVARFGAPTVASALLSGSAADLLSPQDEESARDRAALISRAHTLQTRCYRADPDADLAVGAKTGARYVIPADQRFCLQLPCCTRSCCRVMGVELWTDGSCFGLGTAVRHRALTIQYLSAGGISWRGRAS